jgi:hypothetical protein
MARNRAWRCNFRIAFPQNLQYSTACWVGNRVERPVERYLCGHDTYRLQKIDHCQCNKFDSAKETFLSELVSNEQ